MGGNWGNQLLHEFEINCRPLTQVCTGIISAAYLVCLHGYFIHLMLHTSVGAWRRALLTIKANRRLLHHKVGIGSVCWMIWPRINYSGLCPLLFSSLPPSIAESQTPRSNWAVRDWEAEKQRSLIGWVGRSDGHLCFSRHSVSLPFRISSLYTALCCFWSYCLDR